MFFNFHVHVQKLYHACCWRNVAGMIFFQYKQRTPSFNLKNMRVQMSKRRVKQQNIWVIGLFKLVGRHKKTDDVFVYHKCQSTRWSHSSKNKNKQTQSKTTFATCLLLSMFVHFFTCLSYTFCLLVRLNCIKRAVFKPFIFPAYSTNIVIVIFNKWLPLLSDLGHRFAAHGLLFLLFLPVFT